MATTTFFPSADDTIFRVSANSVWTDLVNGVGTGVGGGTFVWDWTIDIEAGTTTDRWSTLRRSIFTFDTSALGTDTIDSATFSLRGHSKADTGTAILQDGNVFAAGGSGSTIVAGDFQLAGSTAFSTAIGYVAWSVVGYNDFVLNASGEANIDKSGTSRFCFRNVNYDLDDSAPAWSSASNHELNSNMENNAGTASDPKLVVNHSEAATAGASMMNTLNYYYQ